MCVLNVCLTEHSISKLIQMIVKDTGTSLSCIKTEFFFKIIVQRFGKCTYSLTCSELMIDTIDV